MKSKVYGFGKKFPSPKLVNFFKIAPNASKTMPEQQKRRLSFMDPENIDPYSCFMPPNMLAGIDANPNSKIQ